MKKWLISTALTAGLLMFAGQTNAQFSDVTAGSEQAAAIEALTQQGVIGGYPDGTFRPSQYVTRAQAAKMFAGVYDMQLGEEMVYGNLYADIPMTHPYASFIYGLRNFDYFSKARTHFYPSQFFTRGHTAKLLAAHFPLTSDKATPFTDSEASSYQADVRTLYHYGITKGVSPTLFGVNRYVTRGQLVTLLYRMQQVIEAQKYTFQAEALGLPSVALSTVSTKSTGSISLYPDYDTAQSVSILPDTPGVVYVRVGEYAPTTADPVGNLTYYKVTNTMRDGRMDMAVEKLANPIYDHFFMYVNAGETVTVTNGDGTAANRADYNISPHYNEQKLTIDAAGDYLIHRKNAQGSITYALSIRYEQGLTKVKRGVVARNGTFTYEDRYTDTPITKVAVTPETNTVVTATLHNNQIVLQPQQAGPFTLHVTYPQFTYDFEGIIEQFHGQWVLLDTQMPELIPHVLDLP